MTGDRVPSAPADLVAKGRGRRFWRAVLADHVLRADELELLAEACRLLDLLDQLRAASSPLVVTGKAGPRTNPAVVEARQTRVELRRTLAQLCLPDQDVNDDEEELPAEVASFRSARARKAARARWDSGGV